VVDAIDVVLPKAAVIVARVTDETGDPIPGILVQALQMRVVNGQSKLSVATSNGSLVGTDDRGEVRLFGLAAGEYYVAAKRGLVSGFADHSSSPAQVFYPGTISVGEAQQVKIGGGEEIAIVFPLVRTRVARVAGRAVSSNGLPISAESVQLIKVYAGGISAIPVVGAKDGTFSATSVSPGDYLIQVRAHVGVTEDEYASLPLQVSGEDISDLLVTTSPPASIRGRITFDVGHPPAWLRASSIRIAPEFNGISVAPGRVTVSDDWTFQINGILGTGILRVSQTSNRVFLKEILVDGREVTDLPLDFKTQFAGHDVELRLSEKRTEVTGSVVDELNKAIKDYVVIAFVDEPEKWTSLSRFIAVARPDQTGRFSIVGLPPAARYCVIAVNSLAQGEERSHEALERLRPGTMPITLGEGESKTLILTLSSRR